MANINWTKVDGVTTVWTETPAPLRAGLLFRTGRVDETLATGGRTHLIEHMSLSAVSEYQKQHNGLVGGVVTGFFTMGAPSEVAGFLANICRALGSLPGNRLDGEKQVLAAESATHNYDFRTNLLTWRYGAIGYGQIGLPELGLHAATLEQLQDQAARRFTAENAILWLSGPIPDELRLRLPHGTKLPIPPITSIHENLPGWFVDNNYKGIAVGTIVPRVYAATLFCEIASRRLLNQLRSNQAISYAPSVLYDPLNADIAHLVLYADSEAIHRIELVKIFGDIFNGFCEINDEEVEAARDAILERQVGSLAPPPADLQAWDVQRAAMDWIMGAEYEPFETFPAQYRSVTAGDLKKFAVEMQATAMFALPLGVPILPCFGKMLVASKAPPVNGQTVINLDAPIKPEKLVYGPDGVSSLWPKGVHSTVRYSDLAAVLRYDDGGVRLIGLDAGTVMIEPRLWRDGQTVCGKICEKIPAHLLIHLPARPTDSLPKPTTTAWQRFRAHLNPGSRAPQGRRYREAQRNSWLLLTALVIGLLWIILMALSYR